MDGFTGLDKEQAIRTLDAYVQACQLSLGTISEAMSHFTFQGSKLWFSPNAVAFSEDVLAKFTEVFWEGYTTLEHIKVNILNAINSFAEANGESLYINYGRDFGNGNDISQDINPQGDLLGWSTYFESSKDGEIGMNKTLMKNLAYELSTKVNKAISYMDEIPLNISLYDPVGALQHTYRTIITNVKNSYQESFDAIMVKLVEYIETEVDKLEFAKNQAVQELSA